MSPPLLPQDITMTSETEETVLDLEALPTFHSEREETARITLCGSTKFRSEFELWNKRLTLAGFLVYSVSGFGHSGDTFTDEEKVRLDQVHLAKIDASHAIVVINPGGYIGTSTANEIKHARSVGKKVYFTHQGDPTVFQLRTGPEGSRQRYRAFGWEPVAALSPPSTGGAGEAVAWRCLNVHGDAFLTEDANGAHFWLKSGKPVQPLYLHPSPEMGEISREEIARLVDPDVWAKIDSIMRGEKDGLIHPYTREQFATNCYYEERRDSFKLADAILSKLKENGLSREGLGGLARSQPGAAGPSDCAESDAPLSDGGRG